MAHRKNGIRLVSAAALFVVLACLFFVPAGAEASSGSETPGFKLLRMAAAGSFGGDPDDTLNRQILAAVLPLLLEITPDEITAFAGSSGLTVEEAERAYNLSLAHALLAAIRIGTIPAEEHPQSLSLLMLFLEENKAAEEQKADLRRSMTEESLSALSAEYGLPVTFVRFIVTGANWNTGYAEANGSPANTAAPYGNGSPENTDAPYGTGSPANTNAPYGTGSPANTAAPYGNDSAGGTEPGRNGPDGAGNDGTQTDEDADSRKGPGK